MDPTIARLVTRRASMTARTSSSSTLSNATQPWIPRTRRFSLDFPILWPPQPDADDEVAQTDNAKDKPARNGTTAQTDNRCVLSASLSKLTAPIYAQFPASPLRSLFYRLVLMNYITVRSSARSAIPTTVKYEGTIGKFQATGYSAGSHSAEKATERGSRLRITPTISSTESVTFVFAIATPPKLSKL